MEILVTNYGPIAFGVIALLVIWLVIVKPILESSRIDTKVIQEIVSSMRETAIITSATVARLDRLLEKEDTREVKN